MLNILIESAKKYSFLWFFLGMVYIAVSVIALYTPMHSDDFRYATLGLDFDEHLHHYLTWSGRIVADYASTLMFSLQNRVLIALVNSLGTVLLVYNIAALPSSLDKSFDVNKVALLSILIFFTYWIASPNLGQVMFWVVGSANYLWTTLAIIYFLRKIIQYQEQKINSLGYLVFAFITGIIAGCTNENTSVTLLLFMSALLVAYRYLEGQWSKLLIVGLSGCVLGAAVLILSPGNFARAGSYSAWQSIPLFTKIYKHFLINMPGTLMVLSPAIMIFVLQVIMSRKNIVASEINTKKKYLTLGFILASLCSSAVLVASPTLPPRVMNAQLIFLLCGLSFYSSMASYESFKRSTIKLAVFSGGLFILSYICVFVSFKHTYEQSEIRKEMVLNAKQQGKNEVDIPQYYFRRLLKGLDKFDEFHSPDMAGYLGINRIKIFDAGFDFSIIKNDCQFKPVETMLAGRKVKCIYAYHNDLFTDELRFIIELAASEQEMRAHWKADGVFLQAKDSKRGTPKAMEKELSSYQILGRTFVNKPLNVYGLKLNDVTSIEFGEYEPGTNTTLTINAVKRR